MVLSACGYMLQPLMQELRSRGIPFHNPYRRTRGDWNPLRGPAQRLVAFEECAEALLQDHGAPLPGAKVWRRWLGALKSKDLLPRGLKRRLKDHEGDVTYGDLETWLPPPVVEALAARDVPWLVEHMLSEPREQCAYPLTIWKAGGVGALQKRPRLILGTIHSVKGGEADAVYLFPDLSYQSKCALERNPEVTRNALIRQCYVGMTRAREDLVLGSPSSKHFVKWRW